MKINLLHDYIDPTRGGIENTAYYLLKELQEYADVKGFSREISDPLYRLDKVQYTNSMGKKFKRERLVWVLKQSKRDRSAIHVAMNWYSAVPCLISKLLYGNHYIVLAHGNEIYFNKEKIHGLKEKIKYYKRTIATKLLFDYAKCVCCNSLFTEKLVRKVSLRCRTEIIHPGIHFISADNEPEKNDNQYILSIGRLVERKGFQYVISAMPEVLKQFPGVRYYVIGDGACREKLKELVFKNNLQEKVILLGAVSEVQKEAYLRKCSVLVMPSIEMPSESEVEGFGIVYVEANMYGKYVIGSKSGGIPDAVKDDVLGRLLPVVTVESVAAALCDVLRNYEGLYTEDKVRHRIQWAKQHGFQEIAKQYIEVIKQE